MEIRNAIGVVRYLMDKKAEAYAQKIKLEVARIEGVDNRPKSVRRIVYTKSNRDVV